LGNDSLAKKYIVRLTEDERTYLESLIHKGKLAAHKRLHAEILLKADVSELSEKWQDSQISEAFGMSTRTIERVRERLVQEGLESALNRAKPTRVRRRVIDGEAEAHLIALACGDAPDGRSSWTLRLLGQQMVELGYVESVSHETIRQALKKTN
jgi:transposase